MHFGAYRDGWKQLSYFSSSLGIIVINKWEEKFACAEACKSQLSLGSNGDDIWPNWSPVAFQQVP